MRRLTLMLVGTMSMVGAGVFALACSSEPAVVEPGDDDDDATSSGNTSGGSGSGNASGSSGAPGASSGGSSSGGCFAKLRPAPDNGPFCPFVPKSGSSGTGVSCGTGETCCIGQAAAGGSGFDPSGCVPQGDDCASANAAVFECTETNDCPGGNTNAGGDGGADGGPSSGGRVCCMIPNPEDDTATISEGSTNSFGCNIVKGEYGTRCRNACGDRELQGCQTDGECGAGKTCTLVSAGQGDRIYMGICK